MHSIIVDSNGNKYRFYCEASGMAICTTNPIRADTQWEELQIAWESEARKYFNQCKKCKKWVCNIMYNADTLECVDCTPWEDKPLFCAYCGLKIPTLDTYCRKCGKKLRYKGMGV